MHTTIILVVVRGIVGCSSVLLGRRRPIVGFILCATHTRDAVGACGPRCRQLVWPRPGAAVGGPPAAAAAAWAVPPPDSPPPTTRRQNCRRRRTWSYSTTTTDDATETGPRPWPPRRAGHRYSTDSAVRRRASPSVAFRFSFFFFILITHIMEQQYNWCPEVVV